MVSNCGAEVIPFLKTYVNLPGAIAFTVLYSKMTDRMSQKNVYRSIVVSFLAFFASFALILYPNAASIHPHAFCNTLAAALPAGCAAPIGILRYWSFSLFYLMAEMWGSVVVSLLFWGFANTVTTVDEAKKYYPLFGMGANIALIFSGQYVRLVSMLRAAAAPAVTSTATAICAFRSSRSDCRLATAADGCVVRLLVLLLVKLNMFRGSIRASTAGAC